MPRNKLPSTELLEDLCSRFILNVPAEEIETFERLLFLVEQAHWFYEDVTAERDPSLKNLTIKEFTQLIFQKVPGLEAYQGFCNDILRSWQQYKATVPVNGAILLDPTLSKCLLVRGWKSGAGWGFPRGKVSKNEDDLSCAIREVQEETGFDISGLVNEKDYVEVTINGQRSRLYIVPGVAEDTVFAAQVKKEIGAFAWHRLSELPSNKEEAEQVFVNDAGGRIRFFMIWPYMKPLRRWIKTARKGGAGKALQGKANGATQSKKLQVVAKQSPAAKATSTAPVAKPEVPATPGHSLLSFRFDRDAIMQHLSWV